MSNEQFKFIPATEPLLEDDEWEFIADPNIRIQCVSTDYFPVYEWVSIVTTDHDGQELDESYIRHLASHAKLEDAFGHVMRLKKGGPQ